MNVSDATRGHADDCKSACEGAAVRTLADSLMKSTARLVRMWKQVEDVSAQLEVDAGTATLKGPLT